MSYEILQGNCLDILPSFQDAAFDSLITDPPAGIGFMGKDWDKDKGGRDNWIAWLTSIMRECLRVLKPGSHALVWALPRTSHWTATALENAGFEIRDIVNHMFGTGFPKSLDVSKAIDKAEGAERTAKQWLGWGTALKPACEHWILARKPFKGSVAENVLKWGTGGLNIDGCRVETAEDLGRMNGQAATWAYGNGPNAHYGKPIEEQGRFPANLVLSEQAAEDLGDVARYFYCAKASRKERNAGCEGMPTQYLATMGDGIGQREHNPKEPNAWTPNNHPTVKALALMQYLCRLITPPGGRVLDVFAGSGSTGVAAVAEGFSFTGIELDQDYIAIAKKRLAHVLQE